MASTVSKFLEQRTLDCSLSNEITTQFIEGTLDKKNIEDIEDERYSHVITRARSRFGPVVTPNEMVTLEFHTTGNSVAYGRMDGSLTVWKLDEQKGTFSKHAKQIHLKDAINKVRVVTSLSWNSRELDQLATASNSNELYIWGIDDSNNGIAKLKTLAVGSSKTKVNRCIYDPLGKWLLGTTKSELIYLFDVRNDHELSLSFNLWNKLGYQETMYSVAWDNSGTHLFIGLKSGKLIVLELVKEGNKYDFNVLFDIDAHRSSITNLKTDPCGRYLISGSSDGTCAIWELNTFCCVSLIDNLDASVVTLDVDHLGKILAICTGADKLNFYNLNDCSLYKTESLETLKSDLVFKFHPNKSWYILSGKDDTLQNHMMDSPDQLKYWKKLYEKGISSLHNHKQGITSTPGNTKSHSSSSDSAMSGPKRSFKKSNRDRDRDRPLKRSGDAPRRNRFNQ